VDLAGADRDGVGAGGSCRMYRCNIMHGASPAAFRI